MTPGLPSLWSSQHNYRGDGNDGLCETRTISIHSYPNSNVRNSCQCLNLALLLDLRPYGPLYESGMGLLRLVTLKRRGPCGNDTFDRRYKEYFTNHHRLCRSIILFIGPSSNWPSFVRRLPVSSHHSSEVSSVFSPAMSYAQNLARWHVPRKKYPPDVATRCPPICLFLWWRRLARSLRSTVIPVYRVEAKGSRLYEWSLTQPEECWGELSLLVKDRENVVWWVIMLYRLNVVVLNEEDSRFQWVINTVACSLVRPRLLDVSGRAVDVVWMLHSRHIGRWMVCGVG